MEKSAVFVWQVEREKYFHVSEKQKEALIVQKIIISDCLVFVQFFTPGQQETESREAGDL